ncbi:MAG: GTPase Era [Candidatus Palauibacterales bacterium]|nr:GTPase Era [Candidatus Palauibacterales bacterium]
MTHAGSDRAPRSDGTDEDDGDHRAGFCALVGLPNVGKSTLLNALVGARLSIVTPKAQTTRKRLRGIYSDERGQIVFIDTPGLLRPRYALQAGMREEAEEAIRDPDTDVLVYVVDCGFPRSLEAARDFDPPSTAEAILCLNKIDRAEPAEVEAWAAEFGEAGWSAVVRTRADEGTGVEELRDEVLERLPESPPLYPPDELSTATLRELAAEAVREACFELLEEEVPYSVAVQVEEFREDEEPLYIGATLHVERTSQKGIVIGESGRMIREIGSRARPRIEDLVGRQVYLDIWVKVLDNWKKRPGALARLGLPKPREEKSR